jgi:hypothetical protein
MSLFRRKTIFHAEEAMPDPEEIRLRFRRRVLLIALLGFLLVLGIPVARDIQSDLHARAGTRKLAEQILESRTLAAKGRAPVSFTLSEDNHTWRREFHAVGETCAKSAEGPVGQWETGDVVWKIQGRKANGEGINGRTLCLNPSKGLELDSMPLDDGKLMITGSRKDESGAMSEAAFLFVSEYGANIQALYTGKF